MLERDPSTCVFVAEAEGRILGLAALHVIPVIERDGATGRITALVVRDEARRSGVGRALVKRVEAEAARRGCDRLEVTSGARRDDAHHFYRRLGFEEAPQRFVKSLTAS
jgi:GNAT superfamily N-acetyltransferase